MSFVLDLTDRIRQLIGLDLAMGEDFSFFQPGGNDHSLQFFYKSFSDEYLDLDDWNRHHLLLLDLFEKSGVNFILDDDGAFATLVETNKKGVKTVQAVMDLRSDFIITIYYFGDVRLCQRINQQLSQSGGLHCCFVSPDLMNQVAQNLETIVGFEYQFEQLRSLFSDPIVFQGKVQGKPAHQAFWEYRERYPSTFNIEAVTGYIRDGAQGTIRFSSSGLVQVDACRLSSFLEMTTDLYAGLTQKYQCLVEKCVIDWVEYPSNSFIQFEGSPIEFWFDYAVEKVDGLIDFLTKGDHTIRFFGISERISRKLWSVKTTELTNLLSLELEIAESMVRVFLRNRDAIPVLDEVERYLRCHISAQLENSVL